MNLQEVLNQAKQLPTVDKIRLIQQLTFDLENDLKDRPANHPQQQWTPPPPPQPNWDMSGEVANRPGSPDIDPSRWEDWTNFPA